MYSTTIIIFFIYCMVVSNTRSVIVYRNAYFDPIDTNYMLSDLSSISSDNICLCRCYENPFCFTANYFGNNQQCILFFAQLNQSQLRLVPINTNTSVYSFENRTVENLTLFERTNETIFEIWNTTAGGDSLSAIPSFYTGSYWPTQPAENLFDGNLTTDYTNHGMCNYTYYDVSCGEKTGFYLTMYNKSMSLVAFYLGTNNYDSMRDPLSVTIEGSNLYESELTFGSSWTLIYEDSSGLIIDPGR
ncbi:unnamed protein product [Adineta steineri]|uniref:Apple domain-containing protein n=1 Tax=Adineta steineri TaxID=433720 RepID=A0A819Z7V9_9BILA|nr:unnamed protein product [Adineta steineri]CAF4169944.1 unnamed protein product [Adineta steineri]